VTRRSFGTTMRMIAREAARAERARQQAAVRRVSADLRATRDLERLTRADAKETARQYLAGRIEEAEELSAGVRERERAIEELLKSALSKDPTVDLLAAPKRFRPAQFNEFNWDGAIPEISTFLPLPLSFLARLVPGSNKRHRSRIATATARYDEAIAAHAAKRRARDAAYEAFSAAETNRRIEAEHHDATVEEVHRSVLAGEHAGVIGYFKLVLESSLAGEPDALSAEVGYSPDSNHMVVDLELPEFSAVPEETAFRYVKSGDRVELVARPLTKRKALYSHLLSQVTLKCLDTVYRAAPPSVVDCLTINGMLDTLDPATGQQVRVCLLSVRVTEDTFRTINLGQVQPEQCLRSLKASVSRSPTELLAVKPLVELDMVDPRFVETMDVMSGLDHRRNLMELSPNEFEGLITNLFASMGLDTRQTRPSRDGGVDCVAFDPRPVFGGKVVIQAKRYRNTVGVSAVRDLFGTVQNEGASKGILVTTSGYGKAAFDFARGKPLELLDGGNLLHLLSEHGGIEARIVMPDGWTDLPVHGE